ncbi:hypothetical protein [Mesorhizobium tianshanense]|uniref:hypothetical protein n=1 Tax=Mesorhizobium tianshanense TaxID=39844 RepID=UPI0011A18F99|nr:hypothetical protein [Mesorhizobium tianshanense]
MFASARSREITAHDQRNAHIVATLGLPKVQKLIALVKEIRSNALNVSCGAGLSPKTSTTIAAGELPKVSHGYVFDADGKQYIDGSGGLPFTSF